MPVLQAWRRFNYAFWSTASDLVDIARREGLHRFALIIAAILVFSALGVFLFEYGAKPGSFGNIWDALWWSIVTAMTVGYGDMYPVTAGGRAVALFEILAFGLFVMPLFVATITSVYVSRRIKEGKGLEEVKFIDHLIICGYNLNCANILEGLRKLGDSEPVPVILVADLPEDDSSELLYRYSDLNLKYVHGDFTSESVLKRANAQHAKYAIVLAEYETEQLHKSDERAILATLTIKSLNKRITVSAEILDPANKGHMKRANADEIVVVGEDSGFLLTAGVLAPGLPEVVRELTSWVFGSELWHRKIPREFEGKTFSELMNHFLQTDGSLLIGLISFEKPISLDDILGEDFSSIDHFIKMQFERSGKKDLDGGEDNVDVHINPGADYAVGENDVAVVINPPGGKK